MRYLQRETDKIIGKNIAKIRKDLGFSQEALARKLEISRRAIGSYECGDRSIPVFLLAKIAEILNVPVTNLMEMKIRIIDERTKEARMLSKIEKIKNLPQEQQKAVFNLIDSLTAAKQTRKAS